MKHTKGIWERGTNTASKEWMQIFCNKKLIAEAKPLNKKGQRQPKDFEEEEANAKLLASAPKLLEQLNRIVLAVEEGNINIDHINYSKDLIRQATE